MLLLYFMLLRTPLEKRWVHLKLLIPNKENKNMWTRRRLWRFDAFETVELVEEVVRAEPVCHGVLLFLGNVVEGRLREDGCVLPVGSGWENNPS